MSKIGNVADVTFFNADQRYEPSSPILPLFRGHGASLKFDGLRGVGW